MFWQCFTLTVILPIIFIGVLSIATFVLVPLAFIFASWYMRIRERKLQRQNRDGANVAFFHPYCNAGGGGERVLWVAIKALLERYPDTNIYIYTVETAEPKTILDKAQNQFNVKVEANKINFIRLSLQKLIEAKTYPYFTLILQSLGSMFLGMEAFMKLNPDVYIDTTGHAFTYPIFRYLAQCPVGSYTHYPVVTSAMTRRVKQRVVGYNNSSVIARNPIFTWIKLLYYKIFRWLYRVVGRCADVVMVNGSWTEAHINDVWGIPLRTHRVFPPCDVTELKKLSSLVKESDPIRIVSVAQFRPEKDHPLMLQAMYELRNLLINNEMLWNKIKLVLVGSCRNEEDEERVQNLKDLAKHLSVENSVQFVVNAPFAKLLQLYEAYKLKPMPINCLNKIKLVLVGSCRNEEDEERVQNLKDLAKHLSVENSDQFVVNAPFARLLQLYQEYQPMPLNCPNKIKLVLVGSCRNEEDEERVQNLKDLAKHLSVENSVQFVVNAPFARLLQLYQTSSIALHAMWNEHFGISVVECMAAGLITIAHRSGGPLADIIETADTSRTGFLACEPDEYARAILEVIALPPEEKKRIVEAARSSVDRFSEKEFEKAFLRCCEPLFRTSDRL